MTATLTQKHDRIENAFAFRKLDASQDSEPRKTLYRSTKIAELDEANRTCRIVVTTNPVEVDLVGDKGKADTIIEVVESWDLDRFERNPVLLWAHKADEPPVGICNEVEAGDFGLRMRGKLMSKDANPRSEQLWHALKGGLIRVVELGFEAGEERWEERDGKRLRVISNANLFEISFVAVAKTSLDGGASDKRAEPAPDERRLRFRPGITEDGKSTLDESRERSRSSTTTEKESEKTMSFSQKMDALAEGAKSDLEYAEAVNRHNEQNAWRRSLGQPVPEMPTRSRFDSDDPARFRPAYMMGSGPVERRHLDAYPLLRGARGELPTEQQALFEREHDAWKRSLGLI